MWALVGGQSNGTASDQSESTNPFLDINGEPEEDSDEVQQTTPTEADFLSKLHPVKSLNLASADSDNADSAEFQSKLSPLKSVFNRFSSTKSNEPKKVKSKVWNHVVSIVLVEGHELLPKNDNTLPDPFVKFKLGTERYKTKSKPKTLSPKWFEHFLLYMFEDQTSVLEISVRDTEMGGREVVLGSMIIDLENLEKEKTHRIDKNMDDDAGMLTLLITICAMAGDFKPLPTADQQLQQQQNQQPQQPGTPPPSPLTITLTAEERKNIAGQYKFLKSFKRFRDIGWLQVKVLKAHGLAAVDMGGKSDPFCVLELINSRLQTQTIYKCLTPEWYKTFTFCVTDIHAVLEVTVYDENPDKKIDFLGRIAIPLLKIRPGERRWYQLKDARMMSRGKGVIQLEIDFVYNVFKAAIRTFNPSEVKYTSPDPKFRVGIMKRNIERVSKVVQSVMDTGKLVHSCFNWESKLRSIVAFVIFLVVTINFELYMIPAALAFIFLKNLLILNIVEGFKGADKENDEYLDVDGDDEEELEKAEKSKGFVEKLQSIQEVCLQVQEAMDKVATLAERVKNAFSWKVPWLSWLALTVLTVATILIYLVPLRYIILVWGINKFTKKLRNPNFIDNNELLDYLSRVPSDKELVQYRELRPEAGIQAAIRKKQN